MGQRSYSKNIESILGMDEHPGIVVKGQNNASLDAMRVELAKEVKSFYEGKDRSMRKNEKYHPQDQSKAQSYIEDKVSGVPYGNMTIQLKEGQVRNLYSKGSDFAETPTKVQNNVIFAHFNIYQDGTFIKDDKKSFKDRDEFIKKVSGWYKTSK